MISYHFKGFTLEFDRESGLTTTSYPDGAASKCPVVDEDSFHAERLGCTPQVHRLAHELAHHLVGIYYYKMPSSPVIFEDAHGRDPREQLGKDAELEEWMATALTYHAFDKSADYGALVDLQGGGNDVNEMRRELRLLVEMATVMREGGKIHWG